MLLGYNTNGMAHHDLFDAVELLADIGYQSVAITIDHTALPPHARYNRQRTQRLRRLLQQRKMRSVIETGARFLLDPREKHEPTLVSRDPAGAKADRLLQVRRRLRGRAGQRLRFALVGPAPAGVARRRPWPGSSTASASQRICRTAAGLHRFRARAGHAHRYDGRLGGAAGPAGMDDLCLTLDIGHLHCQGEGPIDEVIGRWASRLVNVHIEDMRAGVHEHLMFGEGQIDFPTVFAASRRSVLPAACTWNSAATAMKPPPPRRRPTISCKPCSRGYKLEAKVARRSRIRVSHLL